MKKTILALAAVVLTSGIALADNNSLVKSPREASSPVVTSSDANVDYTSTASIGAPTSTSLVQSPRAANSPVVSQ